MSTLKKYESLKGKRKPPLGSKKKVHISMDSLLKIDAAAGSLLADNSDNSLTEITFYLISFNHAVIHSTILVTYITCSCPRKVSLSNSTRAMISQGYDKLLNDLDFLQGYRWHSHLNINYFSRSPNFSMVMRSRAYI